MKYISTRGGGAPVTSAYAIKKGLAEDGGLYMPEYIPELSRAELSELVNLDYCDRALLVLSRFLTDYTKEELASDAAAAYSQDKFGAHPAPVTSLGELGYMLELWHGPTSAFKDMALQIMPRLFVRAQRKCNEERTALILVATSGDTGKAALEGYRDVPGTKIKVFYPTGGVSRVQKLQMQTQEGENVSVSGIVGNFDDAQTGVKRIFSDADFAKRLSSEGVFLSSANSINWGRLVPQIVYYVSAYCDMVRGGAIELGEEIDVCVPTGNFGNIFACFIAKKMGLPVNTLICASNKNDVLTEFLTYGRYNRCRDFHTTISPSMDILISSNLERLLYVTLGADKTREYMEKLNRDGEYTLCIEDFEKISSDFVGFSCDEDMTRATIKKIWNEQNCLIDTHTAVAAYATLQYKNTNKAERKVLTVSTASAYKFARDVYFALTESPVDDLEALEALCRFTGCEIPAPLKALTSKEVIHTGTIAKENMEAAVLEFAAR